MAESGGRAGKSGGSGAGKGAVSAEQVRAEKAEGGGRRRPEDMREEGAPRLLPAFAPGPRSVAAHRGGSWEKAAEPAGERAGWEAKAAPPRGVGGAPGSEAASGRAWEDARV